VTSLKTGLRGVTLLDVQKKNINRYVLSVQLGGETPCKLSEIPVPFK
jgi:hypothetical protein